MSGNAAIEKIEEFLDKKVKVYCEISDRDGKINQLIISVDIINLKLIFRRESYIMEDKFLYNLIYNMEKNFYSLTVQDEYYEKILLDNGDNEV